MLTRLLAATITALLLLVTGCSAPTEAEEESPFAGSWRSATYGMASQGICCDIDMIVEETEGRYRASVYITAPHAHPDHIHDLNASYPDLPAELRGDSLAVEFERGGMSLAPGEHDLLTGRLVYSPPNYSYDREITMLRRF